jgi:hypothetical protein
MIKNYYSTLFIFVAIYGLISSLGIIKSSNCWNWTTLQTGNIITIFMGHCRCTYSTRLSGQFTGTGKLFVIIKQLHYDSTPNALVLVVEKVFPGV